MHHGAGAEQGTCKDYYTSLPKEIEKRPLRDFGCAVFTGWSDIQDMHDQGCSQTHNSMWSASKTVVPGVLT